MPKLNSARIVNLVYNNDHRHIHNEIFNFYGGENALINMENGGGKSVIIQFLKQPILPLVNIKDRKIENFFKSTNKPPTYIMLEFKLDNNSGYLLVGICLKMRVYSSSKYEDINSNDEKMDFFTFISGPYNKANKFDLQNFPVMYQEKGLTKVYEFQDMWNILKKEESKGTYKIQCFKKYNKKEYYKQLVDFKIYPREWKDLMVKINEQESGINEIFDNAKTSQKLLEYWILDAIEKNLNIDNKNYSQDLEVYVDEVIRVEKELMNKVIYENFITDINSFNEKIDDLIENENGLEITKLKIYKIYNYLNKKIEELKEEKECLDEQNAGLNMDLEELKFSRESYIYHNKNDELIILKEGEDRLKERITKAKEILRELEFERDLLIAAQKYSQIINLESSINSKKIRLNKIEDSNINVSREINKIKFNLKLKYENIIKELENKFSDCKKKILELDNKLNINTEKIENLSNEKNDISSKQSVAKKVIEDTKDAEKELNEKYNIVIERYLTDEPITPIKEIVGRKERDVQELKERIKEIDLRIDSVGSHKKTETNKLKELNVEVNKQSIVLAEIKSEIENYHNALNKCSIHLSKYKDLNIEDVFNKDKLNNYFTSKIQYYKGVEEKVIGELSHIQKELDNIENNNFYIDENFLNVLKEKDIEFETGVQFINTNTAFQNKKTKEKVLNDIPFLPYCIVVSDRSLGEIMELDLDTYTTQMIPIISKGILNSISVNYIGNTIALDDKVKFILSYNKRVLEKESLKKYQEELERQLEDIKAKKKSVADTISELISSKDILLSFQYDDRYIAEKENELENAIRKQESINQKIEETEKTIVEKEKEIERLNNEKLNITQDINNKRKIIEALKKFDLQNEKYLESRKMINKYAQRLKQIDITMSELKEKNSDLRQGLKDQQLRKYQISENIKNKKEKYEEYKEATGNVGEITDKAIDVLESELKEWSAKINTQEIESLRIDIERDKKTKEGLQKELSRLPVTEDDYKNIIYEEERHDKVLLDIKKKEKVIEEYDSELKYVSEKRAQKEGEVNNIRRTIIDQYNKEPRPKYEIKNIDFGKREKDILEHIKNNGEKIQRIETIIKGLETASSKIESSNIEVLKDDVDSSTLNYNNMEDIKRDIKKILQEYNMFNNKILDCKGAIKTDFQALTLKYENKISSLEEVLSSAEKILSDINNNRRFIKVKEYFIHCIEKINAKIEGIKLTEQKLEDNKESIARMCFDYIKLVYDEIMKINKNSKIMIHGKKRNMLLVEMDEITPNGKDTIKQYIEQCSNIIKDLKKNNEDSSKIRKKIQVLMSTRELLNQVSNLSHVKIKTYKIDINPENSGTKLWEEAIVDNSGGEKFVVYFTVFVTILSYIRSNNLDEDDKVIIMDNPFGPITSEHLLKPLFDIAKQYRTQLICFTDLKQHAIYECFDLIYLLKIIPYSYDKNKEYVDVIEQKNNLEIEVLDKAVYRLKTYEGTQLELGV